MDLIDCEGLINLFKDEYFDIVVNLVVQVGVCYLIENFYVYIELNIVGFLNLLECCWYYLVNYLVYVSLSSIYGLNDKVFYVEIDKVDFLVSLYVVIKKLNELMVYVYSKFYSIFIIGVCFFIVYGFWGCLDMVFCLFMKVILNGDFIKVFNNG